MKKIILIILSFIVIFTLSACSNTETEILSESNKSEFILDNIDLGMYDDVKNMYPLFALIKTEGTRTSAIFQDSLRVISEIPNEQIWLLSKNGEFLSEEPFESFDIFKDTPEKWYVRAVRDGMLYVYYIDDATGNITYDKSYGFDNEELFDYTIYSYYWDPYSCLYGINTPEKNIVIDPVYYDIQIPFEDRIILFNGNGQIFGECIAYILTPEKEILSSCFNRVWYSVFDDGSYIGIALCGGNGIDPELQLYDSEGNLMPDGYWLIDKNGKIISERYDFLYINEEWNYISESKTDMIFATTAEGEEISFSISDVVLTP